MLRIYLYTFLLGISVFFTNCKKEDTSNISSLTINSMSGNYYGTQQITYLLSQSVTGVNDTIIWRTLHLFVSSNSLGDSMLIEESFLGPVAMFNYSRLMPTKL